MLDRSRPVTASSFSRSAEISWTVDASTGVCDVPRSLTQSCSDLMASPSTSDLPDVERARAACGQRQGQIGPDARNHEAIADEEAAWPHLCANLVPQALHRLGRQESVNHIVAAEIFLPEISARYRALSISAHPQVRQPRRQRRELEAYDRELWTQPAQCQHHAAEAASEIEDTRMAIDGQQLGQTLTRTSAAQIERHARPRSIPEEDQQHSKGREKPHRRDRKCANSHSRRNKCSVDRQPPQRQTQCLPCRYRNDALHK